MFSQYLQRFLVLLALGFVFQFSFAQEGAKIVERPGVVEINTSQETAEAVNWGDLAPGTMVRTRISVKNNESTPVKLIRVNSEPGCFTAGLSGSLRDVELKPGEKVDFYVFTSVQVAGEYSFKNELIVEKDGKRSRRGVFQYQGVVNPINSDF